MLNYVNDECNLVNYYFHEALKEYFKEDGEADKMINNWQKWNKDKAFTMDFPKITKDEIEMVSKIRDFDRAKNGDLPFCSMLPVLVQCPHAAVDILCKMQDACGYNINVKTLELINKKKSN